jgi:hypothetical protein
MQITNGIETLTVKDTDKACLPSWTDANGQRWIGPTLAFMFARGFVEVVPDPLTPEEIAARHLAQQSMAWEVIKSERVRRTSEGGYYITSIGKWLHSDTASKTQQLGLVIMGAGLPAGIMWKTMDGSFVEMTQALASEIFSAAVTQETLTFGVAENHREQMLLSADPLNYDYSAGWPLIYEDTL